MVLLNNNNKMSLVQFLLVLSYSCHLSFLALVDCVAFDLGRLTAGRYCHITNFCSGLLWRRTAHRKKESLQMLDTQAKATAAAHTCFAYIHDDGSKQQIDWFISCLAAVGSQ